jgi:glucose-6-phosphate 1-dehydrogenase
MTITGTYKKEVGVMAKKKATTKTTSTAKAKKTSKKKRAAKKAPGFRNVNKDVYFVRVDGQPIKSLLDLAKQMDEMADEVFYHHVTPDRNDFATWVADALKNESLAQELQYVKDKPQCCYVVMRQVVRQL